jgi:hypothetical protein
MRHARTIALCLGLAVPFGVALWQDRGRPVEPTDGEPQEMRDLGDIPDPEAAALDEVVEEPEPEPAPEPEPPLTDEELRGLVGREIATPGRLLAGLRIGMSEAQVDALPEAMHAWLQGYGESRARLSLFSDERGAVRGIGLQFPDVGGARDLLGAMWGEPTQLADGTYVWHEARSGRRALLAWDARTGTVELSLTRYTTPAAILGERGGRLGFETTAILGRHIDALTRAYAGVGHCEQEDRVLSLPQPPLLGSGFSYTEVTVVFDEQDIACAIDIDPHLLEDARLEAELLAALRKRFGEPREGTDGRLRYGTPTRAIWGGGVLTLQRPGDPDGEEAGAAEGGAAAGGI